tara:strand:+ start:116 stop:3415 length:3300 start_codon:yes stop_codon:yes gene_type:complete
MRIGLFLFLVSVFQAVGSVGYSQSTKITLKSEALSLVDVLSRIEDQSEYRFIYDKSQIDLDRKAEVDFEEVTVKEVLEELFVKNGVDYQMVGTQVILKNSRNYLLQQQRTISGKVHDSSGEPLPGVTVIIKGTTQGAVTDFDGNYTIAEVPSSGTLVFSFVGMRSQEIPVGNQSTINVVLAEDAIGIEEVVAIGYGSVKKSDLTGAVGSVQGEVLADRQTTQISQALQGATAGVMVTRNSSDPGAGATIRIRGVTSIGDSNPLIIVDGVPVDNINHINPNDVQDISILKDAASASIYGARAAAGVILVTTKRAKQGQLNIDYNFEYGIEKPTTIPEPVDVVRYLQIINEQNWNDIGGTNEYPIFEQNLVDNYKTLNAQSPDEYPDVNMYDLVMKSSAPFQRHNLSVNAGTKTISSRFSLGYDNIDALYIGRSYERITARINNDINVSEYLGASVDMYWKNTNDNRPSVDPMFNALIHGPIYPAEWTDGRVASGKSGDNIYGALKYGGFNDNAYNQISGRLSVDLKPFDGLTISGVVSPTIDFSEGKSFLQAVPVYTWDDPTVFETYLTNVPNKTKLTEERNKNMQTTWQFLGKYVKSTGNHNFNLLAGYEYFYAKYESLTASRDQFIVNLPYLDMGPLEYRDNSGKALENAYRSVFGRAMYNYDNRYFVQGNVRYDGSSRFHEDYRWGVFPSASVGWLISEESFMQDINWLSYLKLRSSYGALGNERIGNYPYQSTMSFGNALFVQGNNVISSQTAYPYRYAIQDITWEKTKTFNVGLDIAFWNNNLFVTADYYKKKTSDMLLPLEIPDFIGFENPDQNTGEMETKGWDMEIKYSNKIDKLGYSVAFNISDSKTLMGDLGGTEFLGSQVKVEGSEFNEWYGYLSDNLFQTQSEVDNSAVSNINVKPGDVKYIDISGPDGEPDGLISPEYDRVLLGGSLPRYIYGGNLQIDYKRFDLSIAFQGVGNQNSRLSGSIVTPIHNTWGTMFKTYNGNFWSQYNTEEENQKAIYPRLTAKNRGTNSAMSDFWLIKGSYFRLKNITLAYNVPSSILPQNIIKGVKVYGSVSDVFTIDHYPDGYDPERAADGYPITTSIMFGANIKF